MMSTPDAHAGPRRELRTDILAGAVAVLRQQQDVMIVAGDVGGVDAGIRQHIAVAMRDDQHALAMPHDLGQFAKDQLDQPRVLVDLFGELDGARRRRDGAQIDDPSLRLRDDLLRDDENVAGLQASVRTSRGLRG